MKKKTFNNLKLQLDKVLDHKLRNPFENSNSIIISIISMVEKEFEIKYDKQVIQAIFDGSYINQPNMLNFKKLKK